MSLARVLAESQSPTRAQALTRLRAVVAEMRCDAGAVLRLASAECDIWASCTDAELCAYVRALCARLARERGQVPEGWDEPATCAACGPVWLWPGVPARVLACPWCAHRQQGGTVPRPGDGAATDGALSGGPSAAQVPL